MIKPSAYHARHEAREERLRQTAAAGLVSDRFPGVSSIVVTMRYGRASHAPLLRTLHFYPDSFAFFRIGCLSQGCERGVLDLTAPIRRMVRHHETSLAGELHCDNADEAIVHPRVQYQVAITYS